MNRSVLSQGLHTRAYQTATLSNCNYHELPRIMFDMFSGLTSMR